MSPTEHPDPLNLTPSLVRRTTGAIIDERFQITGILGSGGASTVYRATQLQLGREVAIKVLRHSRFANEESSQRFQREAQIISNLRHPNIVLVYAYGLIGGYPYTAMELIEGMSLAQLLEREKRLTPQQALPIFEHILDALAYAHKQGVIHRDIKPSNVMLVGQQRTVKLVDFGLAKVLPEFAEQMSTLTTANSIKGTVLYISPEQAESREADRRSDLYSMGCLMYETLVGRPPFSGENALAVLMKHAKAKPPGDPLLDNALGAVVLSALEKDPDRRPQSAQELKLLLLHAPRYTGRRSTVPFKEQLSFHRFLLIAVCLIVLSSVLTGLWFYLSGKQAAQQRSAKQLPQQASEEMNQ